MTETPDMNDKTPSAFPVDLTDDQVCAVALALGATTAAIRTMIAKANEALERNARSDAEEAVFAKWWHTIPAPITATEAARRAWFARADIHRDYEARVEADTEERMNNTSAEMDRVTEQRDRARAEVNRLQAIVKDQNSRLATNIDELRRTKAKVVGLEKELQDERWECKQLKDRIAELERDKRIDLPPLPVGIDTQADGTHIQVPIGDGVADFVVVDSLIDAETVIAELRAEAAKDQAATVPDPAPAAHPPPTAAEIAGTFAVLREVGAERVRQHAKWGRQEHPLGRRREAHLLAEAAGFESNLEVMGQRSAKARCNTAFRNGFGTYSHILLEEVSEAIDADTIADMRTELIQVAAVAVQMVEAIDRQAATEAPANG